MGFGAGDMTISPSQSSVGALLSGIWAAISLNVQSRLASGCGIAAVAMIEMKQIQAGNQLVSGSPARDSAPECEKTLLQSSRGYSIVSHLKFHETLVSVQNSSPSPLRLYLNRVA